MSKFAQTGSTLGPGQGEGTNFAERSEDAQKARARIKMMHQAHRHPMRSGLTSPIRAIPCAVALVLAIPLMHKAIL